MNAAAAQADATAIIDRRMSAYQVFVFLLCASVVFLDGVDTQVAGIAAPLAGRELGIAKAAFGWVFAACTLGATLGALACGVIADHVGRRRTLITATILFGLATLATAQAHSFGQLAAWRFVTGLGLGGAVPCLVALTSEYAPSRHRARIVSLLWAGFPLGAALGALINSYIVASLGWRPLFIVWGTAPLVVALVHIWLLPESVSFLAARGRSTAQIERLLRRIDPAVGRVRVDAPTGPAAPRPGLGALFQGPLRLVTIALALTALILFGLLTVAASWMPSLLTPFGFSPAAGALIVSINGFGSFLGTTGAGFLLEKVGVVRTTLPALAGAVLSFVLLGVATSSFGTVALASVLLGICLGVGSSSVIALAALTYPTAIRSTGVGWTMGAGRFGSVISPIIVGRMIGADLSMLMITAVLAMLAAAAIPCIVAVRNSRARHGEPLAA